LHQQKGKAEKFSFLKGKNKKKGGCQIKKCEEHFLWDTRLTAG